MRRLLHVLACAILAVSTAGCASQTAVGPAVAPQPVKAVSLGRLYTGVWHEVARSPMKLTDGCVGGIVAFSRDGQDRVIDRHSCRMGDPDTGREKVFSGRIDIVDAPTNAKFTTHYGMAGPFGPGRTYWILDHDDGYNWFIAATPDMKALSLYTRDAHIALLDRGRLVDRVRAVGYDGLLEYPAQPVR